MNTGRNLLETRAALHAALADPLRLRIVDLLVLGDLTPGELVAQLAVSTNLLAHHLAVLEREGIIVRERSEGDRRRTYVRLQPAALTALGPSADAAARRVVFVCTANSARSQLAEALWSRSSNVPAVSAGTHPAPGVAEGAVQVAARHGVVLAGRPKLYADVVEAGDYVITVCDRAHEELGLGDAHWSIPDPVPDGSSKAFELAFEELARRIDSFAAHLMPS
ncbi:ArsR family transcriptional regulator [Leifsonia sp. 71-9]|jgi:protein-tyrosine-phosphatase/DNA-binding HxlR family transcriptional regulator|uniref:arsenate reductase/protein-tyrosine-phosphatase family protein n=1 Tax=Leifsonia sp. 71-9 TaxID=1895934 RepID=UPI0009296101|nr:ArsR family transcriptional regulator [Leifsonia sp. 71-9]OJX75738.1 MAG: ArsR family transcriptional regulator [Leifsonia sp. 71-9]